MNKHNFLANSLVILFLLLSSACTKETISKDDNTSKASYNLSTTEIIPMQLVGISSTDTISNEKLFAKIGETEVELIKTDQNNWSFLCPVLPSGSYTIKLENKFDLSFIIKTYTPIQDPETVFTQFKTEISQMKTSIEGSTLVNKGELQSLLTYYQSAMDESTAKMNAEEKLQLAYFINSNGYETTDFSDQFDKNLPDSFLWKFTFDPNDATDMFIVRFASARINGIIASSAAFALFLAPDPTFITKGLGVVASIVAITNIAILHKLIDNDLPRLLGRAVDIDLLNKKSMVLNLIENEPFEFDARGNFSNFTNNDKALGVFPSLFKGIDEINKSLSKFYSGMKTIKSWFITSQPETNSNLFTVGNTSHKKQFYQNPKYVSLTNVSNPNINVVLTVVGNRLQLKATSTSIKTKTNFTITLKYNQASINSSTEKIFDAVFIPEAFMIMDDEYKFVPPFIFLSDKPKTFYLTPDYQKRATGIDYSKIEVRNNSNSNVDIIVGYTSGNFNLTLKNKNPWKEYLNCDIYYKGVQASGISAEIFPDCKGLNANVSLSGKMLTSNVQGGTAPFTYKFKNDWVNPTEFTSANQSTLVYDGFYSAIVKDSNGCLDTADGCIDNVVITGVKANQYDGTSTGRGQLEISWSSSLGLKPEFIMKSGTNYIVAPFTTASSHNQIIAQDITKYCNTLGYSASFQYGFVTGDNYSGTYKTIMNSSTSGSTSVTIRLIKCSGVKICPNNIGQSFTKEYTISW